MLKQRLNRMINPCAPPILSPLRALMSCLAVSLWSHPVAAATPATDSEAAQQAPTGADELTRLGDTYFNGEGVARDTARALSYYEQAATLGSAKAMWRLGEALVDGKVIAADKERGIALLKMSAELANSGAVLALAQLHEKGEFGEAARLDAIGIYEQAATLGRPLALIKLGQLYDKGELVQRDAVKAETYYRQAVAAGRADAEVLLGKLLVARNETTGEGVVMLEKARAAGVPMAAVYLAECYVKGCGRGPDPDGALELLRSEAEAGNPQAGLRLVSIYRDGEKRLARRDVVKADYYLHQILAKLDDDQKAFQRLLLDAAAERGTAGLELIRLGLMSLPSDLRPVAVRKMRITNPNAYVYLLQHRLKELELFSGKPSGTLSGRTIRAIISYCNTKLDAAACGQGPMTPKVADVMAAAFE